MPSSIGIVAARARLCTKITEHDRGRGPSMAIAGQSPTAIAFTLALLLLTSVRIRTRHPAGRRRGGESVDEGGRTSHGPCLREAAARASEAMHARRWRHLAASNGVGVF